MAEFEGKVAIVTGAAMGIGRGIAEAFLAEGACTVLADIDGAAAHATAGEIGTDESKHLVVECDVAKTDDVKQLIDATTARFGGLDIVVNNAGIQPPSSYLKVEDMPEEAWDRIIDVNLKAHYLTAHFAIPEIRKRGGGSIINIASVQGLQSQSRVSAYAASKGGVLSLTRQLALDYAGEGIRVTAVCPGTIDTPLVKEAADGTGVDLEALKKTWGAVHPIGRIGQPSEIASAVLFLASDRASFITGEYLCVDGGMMALGAWAGSPADF